MKQINNSKDVKAAMRHRNIDVLGENEVMLCCFSLMIDLLCDSLLGLDNNILTIERIQMLMQAVIDDSEKAQIMVCWHLCIVLFSD